MLQYDRNKPLIFCHIPKTAGTAVRQVFASWYGRNLLQHYKRGPMPVRHDLANPPVVGAPVLVFGHFNRQRGFGSADYYPEVTQFVTLLRDPWERVISNYHYHVKSPDGAAHFSKVAKLSLEEYLAGYPYQDPDYGPPMTNFLPKSCDFSDFREMVDTTCVAVAIQDELPASLTKVAETLGFPFSENDLPRINVTERSATAPDHLLPAFRKRCALEYAIYDYARELNAG